MKRVNVLCIMLGMLALCAIPALADVSTTVNFPASGFRKTAKTEGTANYECLSLAGCINNHQPGMPLLPSKTIFLSIPANEEPDVVETTIFDSESYTATNLVYPGQYPIAANGESHNVVFMTPGSAYSVDKNYPGASATVAHSGILGGYKIVAVTVYPMQYNPVKGALTLATSMQLILKTKSASVAPLAYNVRTEMQNKIYRNMISALVSNSAEIPAAKAVKPSSSNIVKPLKLTQLPSQESDAVPYIIISESPFDTVFQRLADWKTKKGLPTVVKKVSWINQNYVGIDLPDKMRNFVRDCYSNWGTVYVLLGGGPEVVPCRYTRSFSKGYTADALVARNENVPSDMYYSDLDGTWNTDGDNFFGEGPVKYVVPPDTIIDYNDTVDMYPEVFVGRASVDSIRQAQSYVSKIMTYETNSIAADSGFSQHLAFWASVMDTHRVIKKIDSTMVVDTLLWDTTYVCDTTYKYISTPTDTTKKFITSQYLPADIMVDTLFNYCDSITGDITYDFNKTTATAGLNGGSCNIINHINHSGWNQLGVGNLPIYMYETDNFSSPNPYILTAFMGCEVIYYDRECFAEHLMNCPGGPAAYIGNTRVGWYIKYDSKNSPSNKYDETFYKYLYLNDNHGFYNIGQTLAMGKMDLISEANVPANYDSTGDGATMRWCMFELSLLGDPEMPIWTKAAKTLTVSPPTSITLSDTLLRIGIRGTIGDTVTVCAQKGSEAYAVMEKVLTGTGPGGTTFVSFYNKPNTTGTINITVTGRNYLPWQGTCPVGYDLAANLYVSSFRVSDSLSGNRDGVLNPGETVNLYATVKNSGKLGIMGITAKATPADSLHLVSFSDDTAYIATLKAGASAICQFKFTLLSTMPLNIDYYPFTVDFKFTIDSVNKWKDEIAITARADSLVHTGHKTSGNIIYPQITNIASGSAFNVTAKLRTADPNVRISDSLSNFGSIKACSTKLNTADGFVWSYIQIPAEEVPPKFTMVMKDNYGRTWSNSFTAVAGILPPDSLWCVNKTGQIDLYWAYNGYAQPAGLVGFNIYRSVTKGVSYSRINLIPLKGMSYYSDNTIDPYTAYYYRVTAIDTSGNESEYSSIELPKYPLIRGWPQFAGRPLAGGRACNSSPAVADINVDGINEVIVSSYEGVLPSVGEIGPAPNGKIYGWRADGTVLGGNFPIEVGRPVEPSVCLAALNGTDTLSILHADGGWGNDPSSSMNIFAWDHRGNNAASWPSALGDFTYDSPAAADLNGDGIDEVVVTTYNGQIIVLDAHGDTCTGWPQKTGSGQYSASVADIDPSYPGLEIVAVQRGDSVYAWHEDGTPVPGWPVTFAASISFWNSPVVGDIDRDGKMDIVASAWDAAAVKWKIFVINYDGAIKWNCPLDLRVGGAMVTPALGDVTGDGLLDIVVPTSSGGYDGTVTCISGDGTLIWAKRINDLRLHSSPLIGDINGDGNMEVVINAVNKVFALDRDGRILPGFPFETTIPVSHILQPTPTITDLDKNGTIDIVYRGYDQLYAWDLLANYDKNKIEWGTYKHDFARTGNYHTLPQGVFSKNGLATAYNNARHLVYGPGDTLHLAYNSNDSIIYKSSVNDGFSWAKTEAFAAGGTRPIPTIGLDGNDKIMVWKAETPLAGWVLKSVKNNGGVWGPVVTINEQAGWYEQGHFISPPTVITNSDGLHMALEFRDVYTIPGGQKGTWDWKLVYGFQASGSSGYTWTMIDSDSGSWDVTPPHLPASPTICIDGSNGIHIAWDYEGKIYWRVYDPYAKAWKNKINLSSSPDVVSEEPSLNFYGDVHLVWEEGNDIFHKYGNWGLAPTKAVPNSFYWEVAEDISQTPGTPSLAPVFDGNYVSWSEVSNDGNSEICASAYSNLQWNYLGNHSQSPLTPSVYPQMAYRQDTDSTKISLVWSEGFGAYYNLTGKNFTGPNTPLLSANVGDSLPSIYTIQRDGYLVYNTAKSKTPVLSGAEGTGITVDYDSIALLYYLPYLDPEQTQKIKIGLYLEEGSKGSKEYNFMVSVDKISVGVIKVPTGQMVTAEVIVPENIAQEGRGTLEIKNLNGPIATCDWWEMYASAKTGHSNGGAQSEEITSITPNYINKLYQNSPNPFNNKTSFMYQVKNQGQVTFKVYNALGQLVNTLVNETKPAGAYQVEWDGKDGRGLKVSSGVYIYRLQTGDFTDTKKLVIIK